MLFGTAPWSTLIHYTNNKVLSLKNGPIYLPTMQFKHLTSLSLAGLASGQALTDVISQNANLSTLGVILQANPSVLTELANATNITVLAPSNAAFSSFLTSAVNASIQADAGLVPAVLSYHVLSGVIRSTDITVTPVFPKTLLTNATYTNVTGGQVVKAQAVNGGVVITSGLLKNSHVTTANVAFDGGVVHIIDNVLTIPLNDSATAIGANLTALAGALTEADLVSAVDTAKVSYPQSCAPLKGAGPGRASAELTYAPGCDYLRPFEWCFRRHLEPGWHSVHSTAHFHPHLPRCQRHGGVQLNAGERHDADDP